MILNISRKIFFISLYLCISVAHGNDNNSNRIEILVNEKVITKYDITQRMKINSIIQRVEIGENNYDQLLNAVIDDLIVEKLKNDKIHEFNINVNREELKKHETRFYSNINYEKEELKKLFSINNINFNQLLEFIETEVKWQKLIYGLYMRVTTATQQEINELMSNNPEMSEKIASDIILQKQIEIKSTKLIKDLRDEATIEYK
tara:strand:- start:628 stop:1239 length:612 start_codon:yes stop_codon:yes gene_type:complete